MTNKRIISIGLIVFFGFLFALSHWQTSRTQIAIIHKPTGIMGTNCTLVALVQAHDRDIANIALRETEQLLRDLEALMTNWNDTSEISRVNQGEISELSEPTQEVITLSKQAYENTQGAFDITCRPLIELWNNAAEQGVIPSEEKRMKVRQQSNWDNVVLKNSTIDLLNEQTSLDLGGVAKGYAIDRAVDMLKSYGITDGMVDIGGDLVCFRKNHKEDYVPVKVLNPFPEKVRPNSAPLNQDKILTLNISNAAVCTSGNYARFYEIDGQRYSHIVDPRTGLPADLVPSVTVIAEDAVTADIWATALSVLGKRGMALLPDNVEAYLIIGNANNPEIIHSDHFMDYVDDSPTSPKEIIEMITANR